MSKIKKIGIISLGCDKNRVDSERVLGLVQSNYEITNNIEEANIIVVNTCAFLQSAREESLETVFECNKLRSKNLEKLVLTGCLPEKFIEELFDELYEVDVFLGVFDYDLLLEALDLAYKGNRVNFVKKNKKVEIKNRVLTTPCHYYYLKIADGCNNKCTYCLIPSIRGKYISTPIEELIEEVKSLGEAKEVILVAQDVTRYGVDLYGESKIVELIKELSKLEEVESIRLLYCYPDMISNELINEFKVNNKLIKYIDIPLQHASDSVLKRMNRKGTCKSYLELIYKLKNEIAGIAIRSTFITGFPGETEEDFNILLKFIKEAKLTNCGFFAYSREEGTPAYKLPNQIDEEVKNYRVQRLYEAQKEISVEFTKSMLNKEIEVVCDGIDYDKQCFYGRAYFNAPDIDGKVYFTSDDVVNQGEEYTVLIEEVDEYDLYGRTI
ncbi:MAG: 30S ribosomal protein S12 methylthiotransferase RimO [Clostridia bacterium]|nr:30S ribosomal protein S12 methylthiotransferase RimO [Clostridia bacterium]